VCDDTHTRVFGYFIGDTLGVTDETPTDGDRVLAVGTDELAIGYLTYLPATGQVEIESVIGDDEDHATTIVLSADSTLLLRLPSYAFRPPSCTDGDWDPATQRFRLDAPPPEPLQVPRYNRTAGQAREFREAFKLLSVILESGGKSTTDEGNSLLDAITNWGNDVRNDGARGPNKQTAMQCERLLEQLTKLYHALKAKKPREGLTAPVVFELCLDVYRHSGAGYKAVHELLKQPPN